MHLFLALFILAAIHSVCKGRLENPCTIYPIDPFIEVGSDIQIVCQSSCTRGKIYWELDSRRLDESLSNTINSSHTVLLLRNFTHSRATVLCLSSNTQQVLRGTIIRTYSKPTNISCILHSKNQSRELQPDQFTCKWEHQIDPSLKVNYSVLSSTRLRPSQSEICTTRERECTSDNITSLLLHYTITVRAKTADWVAVSDPRQFYPKHIWKIIPPKLNVNTFSDGVLVKWQRASFSQECHCQVNYSKAVNERVWVVNETVKKYEHGKRTIENLESCSNYTFSVRCALDKAPWSDWSKEKTVLTQLNRSRDKPRLWRKVAEPEKNGVRRVHVMWTEIPSTCQGTFLYTIKSSPYKEHTMGVNYTNTLCGKSTCDVDVSQDEHRINFTIFHNEILYVEDSVHVPAIRESLPQVTDIQTSTLEGVILVSWRAPLQPVSGYMVDWTHDGNKYYWKESKYTNATLSDLLDKKPYNITVTPLFDDKTGHGAQALHICSRVGDPGNVTIHLTTKDKSAFVRWNVTSQGACSGVVVNYTIFYGIPDEPPLNVTVDGSEQYISLKDLIPDTHYSVYVKATALTGTTKSSEMLFKTKQYGSGLITAVSVCGSIVIVLVLSLGLCCAVQWKKFKEKPVPNPGLASSVKPWPTASRQEGMFPAFSNPSESICDRVYMEEAQRTSSSPLSCYGHPASDQTEEHIDSATTLSPDEKHQVPVVPVETQHVSSPDDSTALLPTEHSPYRSQTSVESPASRSGKQCKRIPVKQPEKTAPMTIYVTLDMFEQSERR